MSNTWFISDTHFNHANILQYEPVARPFNSVEEMNEGIITRWNSVIKKHDVVFHLGDFCFGRDGIKIAKFLNGQKRLVLGNHDRYGAAEYLEYFNTVHGALFWNGCLLTHVPVHPLSLNDRAYMNIHGHLHSKTISDIRWFNVSCEQNNLTPINADIIMAVLKVVNND